jgi:hypothetical protein
MVTGALRRNKRNRKKIYSNLELRVKKLSKYEITLEKINGLVKSGCLVLLNNFNGDKSAIIYKVNFEDKMMYVAYYDSLKGYIHEETHKFESNKIAGDYHFEDRNVINPTWGKIYDQLNKKLQIATKN